MNKNTKIILGVIAGVILITILWFINVGNKMISKDQELQKSWANVEAAYQRRLDLYDAIVSTIKGSADFEKTTLTQVIEARNAAHIPVDASKLTPEAIQQFQQAQAQFKSAINVVVEQYPQIQTTQQFKDFQENQAGTENRINKARNDFNDAVQDFNSYILRFPNSFVASSKGFKAKGFFQAEEGASKAPKIDFGTDSKGDGK